MREENKECLQKLYLEVTLSGNSSHSRVLSFIQTSKFQLNRFLLRQVELGFWTLKGKVEKLFSEHLRNRHDELKTTIDPK